MLEIFRSTLKKYNNKFYNRHKYKYAFTRRKKILSLFKEPNNLIERSWFQFKCQSYETGILVRIIRQPISLISIPIFLYRKYKNNRNEKLTIEKEGAVYLSDGIGMEIIPHSLVVEMGKISTGGFKGPFVLGKEEINFIKNIIDVYWHNPFFVFKSMVKIALYSSYITDYNPKAIIVYSEYSFTSSLLTEYCSKKKVEHINVLHGEKLYNIRDAFASFNRFYLWDEHYRKLFVSMRMPNCQFLIEQPPLLKEIKNSNEKTIQQKYAYDYIYYLAGENNSCLKKISYILKELKNKGYRVGVRLHPRASNATVVERIFEDFIIENPVTTQITTSLNRTKGVIGSFTTVLYQAHLWDKEIVIDDLSNKKQFQRLKEYQYIVLKKEHKLLSSLLRMVSRHRADFCRRSLTL